MACGGYFHHINDQRRQQVNTTAKLSDLIFILSIMAAVAQTMAPLGPGNLGPFGAGAPNVTIAPLGPANVNSGSGGGGGGCDGTIDLSAGCALQMFGGL